MNSKFSSRQVWMNFWLHEHRAEPGNSSWLIMIMLWIDLAGGMKIKHNDFYEKPSVLESGLRWLGIHSEVLIYYLESVETNRFPGIKCMKISLHQSVSASNCSFLRTKIDVPRNKVARWQSPFFIMVRSTHILHELKVT